MERKRFERLNMVSYSSLSHSKPQTSTTDDETSSCVQRNAHRRPDLVYLVLRPNRMAVNDNEIGILCPWGPTVLWPDSALFDTTRDIEVSSLDLHFHVLESRTR